MNSISRRPIPGRGIDGNVSKIKIAGVSQIEVNFEKRHAAVKFDDAKTNIDALMDATVHAGYPSSPVGEAK